MPLSETQTALLAELVGESPEDTALALTAAVTGLSAGLTAAVQTQLTEIVTEYGAVRDKHLRVAGGSDGVDLDYDRNRAALRDRARVALKMSASSLMPTFFTVARGCRGR
jgi:hypothetical protein